MRIAVILVAVSIRWATAAVNRAAPAVPAALATLTCPSKSTQCSAAPNIAAMTATTVGAGLGSVGCCSGSNATCCGDGRHCCPKGYRCPAAEYRGSLHSSDPPHCEAADPIKHPYTTWQPLWNLCFGPLTTYRLENITGAAAGKEGLFFQYFSSGGPIPESHVTSTKQRQQSAPQPTRFRAAVVVVHGADRNADEYFCAMREASVLQQQYAPGEVLVIAPWFKAAPPDTTLPGEVYWPGGDPNGVWRAGRESDPAADPSGAGRTVSSYTVLDRIAAALLALPGIELVTVAGHSSGGQTVQRWGFASDVAAEGAVLPTKLAGFESASSASASHPVRLVVANPSSYVYLDDRRWNYSSPTGLPPWTTDDLMPVSAAKAEACPGWNQWEWGIVPGNAPPYVTAALSRHGAAALVARYASTNTTYLLGGNDTCNEALKPGCDSHGLETTCQDMMEGPFRLYRGQHYAAYLRILYGRPVHRIAVVPDVGHDHTLMFQSRQGLAAIFGA